MAQTDGSRQRTIPAADWEPRMDIVQMTRLIRGGHRLTRLAQARPGIYLLCDVLGAPDEAVHDRTQ
jgi:hypothetical protein